MIVAPKRTALDPYAPYDPLQQPGDDTGATAPDSGWMPPPPTPTPAPDPVSSAPPPSRMPAPTGGGTAPPVDTRPPLPQQLPDGGGGSVPIPPPELAPPGVLGPPPTPTPIAPITPDQPVVAPPSDGPPPNRLPTGGGMTPPPPTDTTPWELPAPTPWQPLPAAPPPAPETPPVQIGEGQGPPVQGLPSELPTFGPDNNLINTEVLPQADPRLMRLQGLTDDILSRMTSGPNRFDIAKQYWDEFQKETQGGYDRSFADARNEAAAHGRLKSGILTNTYGDLAEKRARDLDVARSRYLTDALEGTIGDTRNQLADVSGVEGQAYGEGVGNRNEVRGERGYQQGMAEQALIRRIMQQAAESGMDTNAFNQAIAQWQAGQANNPTGALETGAAQAGNEAAGQSQDVEELLRMLLARMGSGAGAGTP